MTPSAAVPLASVLGRRLAAAARGHPPCRCTATTSTPAFRGSRSACAACASSTSRCAAWSGPSTAGRGADRRSHGRRRVAPGGWPVRSHDPLTTAERERLRALPFDETAFRRTAGVLDDVALGGELGYSVYERLWKRPSLSVIAFESQPLHGAANKIVDAARARLSLRTPPGMDALEAGELLIAELVRDVPYAARIEARVVMSIPAWRTDAEGPAFDAARRALGAGFGREAALIGVGGGIGFVEPISRFLRGAPCLLIGVEDPICNAHSENESLDLGDWRRCMRSAVHLYDELARLPR